METELWQAGDFRVIHDGSFCRFQIRRGPGESRTWVRPRAIDLADLDELAALIVGEFARRKGRLAAGMPDDTRRDQIYHLLQERKHPVDRATICVVLKMRQPNVQRLLTELIEDGSIKRESAGMRYLYYIDRSGDEADNHG